MIDKTPEALIAEMITNAEENLAALEAETRRDYVAEIPNGIFPRQVDGKVCHGRLTDAPGYERPEDVPTYRNAAGGVSRAVRRDVISQQEIEEVRSNLEMLRNTQNNLPR